MGARGFRQGEGCRVIGFSSLLCHPFSVSFVDIYGDSDNRVECIMDTISLGEPVLDEGRQVFPVPDQFIIIAQPHVTGVLLEQRYIVLDCLGPLPQLFECREHVASLIDRFELHAESGDKCRIVGEWWYQCFHPLDNTHCLVGSISF